MVQTRNQKNRIEYTERLEHLRELNQRGYGFHYDTRYFENELELLGVKVPPEPKIRRNAERASKRIMETIVLGIVFGLLLVILTN